MAQESATSIASRAASATSIAGEGFCQSSLIFETIFTDELSRLGPQTQIFVRNKFQWFVREVLTELAFDPHEMISTADVQAVIETLLAYLRDQGMQYQTHAHNAIAMFLPLDKFSCNCVCTTFFLLACLECLGLLERAFPDPEIYAAVQSGHIWILMVDTLTGQQQAIDTTTDDDESCVVDLPEEKHFDPQAILLREPVDMAALYLVNELDRRVITEPMLYARLEHLWSTYGFPSNPSLINVMLPLLPKSIQTFMATLKELLPIPAHHEQWDRAARLWSQLRIEDSPFYYPYLPSMSQYILQESIIPLWQTHLQQQRMALQAVRHHEYNELKITHLEYLEQLLAELRYEYMEGDTDSDEGTDVD